MVLYLIIIMFNRKIDFIDCVFYGLITGLMMHFHPVSLLATIPVFFFKIIIYKKDSFKKLIIFIFCLSLFMFPLVLFELRHGFIMTKNTFINRSYKTFINNNNPASIVVPSKNPLLNLFIINKLISNLLYPSSIILLVILLILFFIDKKIFY